MEVTVLIENTTENKKFKSEHGLSLFIKSKAKNILFDTGQSNNFIFNAEKLGIDLNSVDLAVLSHGHYDHSGGIKSFLEINKHAQLFLKKESIEDHYHFNRYIGIDKDPLNNKRIVYLKDNLDITDSIKLLNCDNNDLKYPVNNKDFFIKRDHQLIPENFNHEHYLKIEEDGKTILFSGCTHKGILNITNYFKPDILIGGFHLMDVNLDNYGKRQLDEISKELNRYNCQFYTCHCTGLEQYNYLKEKMGTKLNYLSTGMKIIL